MQKQQVVDGHGVLSWWAMAWMTTNNPSKKLIVAQPAAGFLMSGRPVVAGLWRVGAAFAAFGVKYAPT
jgi:hypothetical protein